MRLLALMAATGTGSSSRHQLLLLSVPLHSGDTHTSSSSSSSRESFNAAYHVSQLGVAVGCMAVAAVVLSLAVATFNLWRLLVPGPLAWSTGHHGGKGLMLLVQAAGRPQEWFLQGRSWECMQAA